MQKRHADNIKDIFRPNDVGLKCKTRFPFMQKRHPDIIKDIFRPNNSGSKCRQKRHFDNPKVMFETRSKCWNCKPNVFFI